MAELIEWSNGVTEIIKMWVWTPADWEIKFFREKKNITGILEERLAWLQELNKEIFEKFGKLPKSPINSTENPDTQTAGGEPIKTNTNQLLPPPNTEGLETVKELSQKGLTVKVIAERASLSESTVKRYRKILGLQRRR